MLLTGLSGIMLLGCGCRAQRAWEMGLSEMEAVRVVEGLEPKKGGSEIGVLGSGDK